MKKKDPYASEAETQALLVPDTRTAAERKLAQMMAERGADEQGAEVYLILRQIAVDLLAEQPAPVQQEPVGYEHHEYRPYGAPNEVRIHAVLASQYKLKDGTIAGDYKWLIDTYKSDKNTIKLVPLYATPQPPAQPAQRTWVGLTDEEIEDCYGGEVNDFARAIEAKLKEKNNG